MVCHQFWWLRIWKSKNGPVLVLLLKCKKCYFWSTLPTPRPIAITIFTHVVRLKPNNANLLCQPNCGLADWIVDDSCPIHDLYQDKLGILYIMTIKVTCFPLDCNVELCYYKCVRAYVSYVFDPPDLSELEVKWTLFSHSVSPEIKTIPKCQERGLVDHIQSLKLTHQAQPFRRSLFSWKVTVRPSQKTKKLKQYMLLCYKEPGGSLNLLVLVLF